MKRKDIMDKCPSEDFEEDLKEFIDEIESKINDIKTKLEITSIADISDITDAYYIASDLCNDLY